MNDRLPAVSVVMPVHNGAATLPVAIGSILTQSLANLEVVVVDDGSTDGTSAFLEGLADERVRLIRRDAQVGLVAALDEGVAAARAEWVARMDADDVAHPDRLARQLEVVAAWPDCGLVATGCEIVDPGDRWIGTRRPPPDHASCLFALHFGNHLTHSTVMFRRSLFDAVGGYRADRFPAEDYDLWLRMARRAQIVTVAEPLLIYRRSEVGVSATRRARQYDQTLAIAGAALEETTGRRPDRRIMSGLVGLEPRLACADFAVASDVVLATRDAVRRDCRARGIGLGELDAYVSRMLRRSGLRRPSGGLCLANAAALSRRHPALAARVAGQYVLELRTRLRSRR